MRILVLLTLAALAVAPFAGCIEVEGLDGASMDAGEAGEAVEPDVPSSSPVERRDVTSPGEDDAVMTGEEKVEESEGLNPGVPPVYFSTRTVTVEGDLTLATLPVLLQTSSGNVVVKAGPEGRWKLVATLTGHGLTQETAREDRDRWTFTWAHENAGEHFIQGVVERENAQTMIGPISLGSFGLGNASLALEIPASLAVTLGAETSSGNVEIEGVRGVSLFADTSSGNVVARAVDFDAAAFDSSSGNVEVLVARVRELLASASSGNIRVEARDVRNVAIETSSGNIEAAIVPAESGGIAASASSGNVAVLVPEDAAHGYSAIASVSSGKITFDLKDGETRSMDDGEEMAFETNGLASRDVRTAIVLEASSGNIRLAPA